MSELLENQTDRTSQTTSHAAELAGCEDCLAAQIADETARRNRPAQPSAACDGIGSTTSQADAFPTGHPAETFRSENAAIRKLGRALLKHLPILLAEGKPVTPEAVAHLREVLNQILDIDKHYLRKEHLLFTCLERHGITGPSKAMWTRDDEVRALLKDFQAAITAEIEDEAAWRHVLLATANRLIPMMLDLAEKEDQILLPMAIRTLTETEWVEIWAQSPQFGWCIVDPGREYRPSATALLAATAPTTRKPKQDSLLTATAESGALSLAMTPATAPAPPARGAIMFPTGALTLDQLIAIFNTMPVDLTFVDADDRVRFFSEGAGRIFVRPKAVIGRQVQHCHPPKSLHLVNQILDDFKAGRQSVAEFWITLAGRFLHIRYFALRDESGAYLGTLEVTQDLTRERTLQGEQRLISYDN